MVKQLAIITWDAASAQLYASQVRDFFGGQVNTRCYSTQLQPDPVIEPADVYLVSTCAFADRDIGQLLPTGGPVVLSEVRVTREGLERLLAIPRNTRALLDGNLAANILLTGDAGTINSFIELYNPYNVLRILRTGAMAMPK